MDLTRSQRRKRREKAEIAAAGSEITFTIPQTPKGKMRHQTVVTFRCRQCQRTIKGQRKECPYCLSRSFDFLFSNEYTPADQREYEKFAAMCAQQGMGGQKFTGALSVECRFFFGIPKSREKKLRNGDWHTQRPDTDNCVKSVWDAMNKICFGDDCSVVQMTATKQWTTGTPRTEVIISLLADRRASEAKPGVAAEQEQVAGNVLWERYNLEESK